MTNTHGGQSHALNTHDASDLADQMLELPAHREDATDGELVGSISATLDKLGTTIDVEIAMFGDFEKRAITLAIGRGSGDGNWSWLRPDEARRIASALGAAAECFES